MKLSRLQSPQLLVVKSIEERGGEGGSVWAQVCCTANRKARNYLRPEWLVDRAAWPGVDHVGLGRGS